MTRSRWLPSAVALVVSALGVLDIASAVTPELRPRLATLTRYVPLTVAHAAAAATVVTGLFLVLVGHGLRRRKTRAWWTAVALLLLSVGLHLAKGLDYEEASVAGALALVLLPLRRQFFAASDPRSRWRAPITFVLLIAADIGIGLGLLAVRDERMTAPSGYWARLQEVLAGLIGVPGPITFSDDRTTDLVFAVLLALGVITVVVPVYLLLRPSRPAPAMTAAEEEALRALVTRQGGQDSLAYFALRDDRSVVFSPTGKAAVSYRVVTGVMLAAGDPLGDPEAWPGAIAEFAAIAARHAWVPAVIGCSERGGETWVRVAGLRALELGDEGVVDTSTFSLEGRAMRNVRQMVNRVERAGYCSSVRRLGELSAAEVQEIATQAAAWRDGETERGFSMALGRFGDPRDPDCVVATAHREGRLAAVLHFVPWGPDGLSLDLMRRDRGADPGLNELLIVAALRHAATLGVRRISLNFAVFRSALERGERLGAGPVLRAWRGLLLVGSRWFQIESLYRFNAKFRPEWQSRFVCYPTARDVPRVAVAALLAEAFLVLPKLPLSPHHRLRWWRR